MTCPATRGWVSMLTLGRTQYYSRRRAGVKAYPLSSPNLMSDFVKAARASLSCAVSTFGEDVLAGAIVNSFSAVARRVLGGYLNEFKRIKDALCPSRSIATEFETCVVFGSCLAVSLAVSRLNHIAADRTCSAFLPSPAPLRCPPPLPPRRTPKQITSQASTKKQV